MLNHTLNSALLNNALHQVLPTANLVKTPVSLLSNEGSSTQNQPFYLWLIDPNFCHQDLTADVIENLWNNCPYWVFAWASGQVLAHYVLQNPHLVKDKVVMDFGAGSGIVGIASKMAGAKQVICCDIDPVSLLACQANADINAQDIDLLDNLFDLCKQFNIDKVDVLLVADVLYDKANLPLLDLFLQYADEIWVADSRVKNFTHPHYQKITTLDDTTTLPDMDEAKQFNQVVIYCSEFAETGLLK
ncbi:MULTISPECIES: class I SAM-dependent methyltransferase [unclassified Moraxella]|uniref:class I SAM-dependent methyltransferase n=1 Tax=unclassified Moraxella TaxID=2685852 RepID=UPI003AF66D27